MKENYKPIKSMKEVPDQLRKLRRQFLRYQQAEIVYSLSHEYGSVYKSGSKVLIERSIFEAYLREQRKG